jgi:GNAT superfamily N-acetyltransferase
MKPVQEIAICRAEAKDIETLVGMRIALLHEVGNLSNKSDTEDVTGATRRYFDEELPAGRYVGFIAQAGDQAVGCGGLTFYVRPPYQGNASGREAYLMGMYTVANWRGKGIGRALLMRLLDVAKTRGVGRVWLHSEQGARSLYERQGFRPNDSHMELILVAM